jgi:ribonuclease BN (tRNA processing enzyme)
MRIRCLGCRGSLPTPGKYTTKYGGNTTCFLLDGADGTRIVIDAGSGIRVLSNYLFRKDKGRELTLLITHAHWDHLMGFPFFLPAYSKKYKIKVKGCNGTSYSLKEIISHQFKAPYFPVKFRHLQAEITFSQNDRKVFHEGAVKVESIKLNHPGGGVGYKFTENGKTIVFLTDNELAFQHRKGLKPKDYIKFSEGADLLIHDAQYTSQEYERMNKSWGHSTYSDAYQLACEAGVKKLGFCHHDPERKDTDLDGIENRYARKHAKMRCFVVKEQGIYRV